MEKGESIKMEPVGNELQRKIQEIREIREEWLNVEMFTVVYRTATTTLNEDWRHRWRKRNHRDRKEGSGLEVGDAPKENSRNGNKRNRGKSRRHKCPSQKCSTSRGIGGGDGGTYCHEVRPKCVGRTKLSTGIWSLDFRRCTENTLSLI